VRRGWLLFALLFVAVPAFAAEPSHDGVLIDADCEDDDASGGTVTVHGTRVIQTQDAGAADGFCDTDADIVKGSALTTDQTFGPFTHTPGEGLYINTDTDSVSGGSADWNTCILADSPQETGSRNTVCCASSPASTGAADQKVWLGLYGVATAVAWTAFTPIIVNCAIPKTYWVKLDLGTSVSWSGSLSVTPSN
jgi:hypothetical protein